MKKALQNIWNYILFYWNNLIGFICRILRIKPPRKLYKKEKTYHGANLIEIRGELIPGTITVDVAHYSYGKLNSSVSACIPIPTTLRNYIDKFLLDIHSQKEYDEIEKYILSCPEVYPY